MLVNRLHNLIALCASGGNIFNDNNELFYKISRNRMKQAQYLPFSWTPKHQVIKRSVMRGSAMKTSILKCGASANSVVRKIIATQKSKFSAFVVMTIILNLLTSCTSSDDITQLQSSNYSYRVKSLVMHFTAVDYEQSINFLVNEGGGVSSHYLIPKLNDATYPKKYIEILQLVDETERAWHAGRSYWQGRSGLNDSSIGIEIVNVPECIERDVPPGFIKPKAMCIYPEFEHKQIDLLISLSKDILARNPDITPTSVVGHSDIAPSRKNDPGPRFPWQKLYEAGIGAWYDNDTVAKYWPLFNHQPPSAGLLQRALSIYGYGIDQTGIIDRQTQDVLGAFQMHFVPWQVTYQADSNTAATVFALLEKYFEPQLTELMAQYQSESLIIDDFSQQSSQLSLRFSSSQENANRIYTSNRGSFLALADKGTMHIQSNGVTAADIFINNEKLNLGDVFSASAQVAQSFNIAKRTQAGINSIRVDNIQSPNSDTPSEIKISIPYPEITNADTNKTTTIDFSRLDRFIQNDVDNGFPGASILVVHKGNIVKQQAYGHSLKYDEKGDILTNPEPMTTSTLFDLASNTKVFATTLAIMKLVDEGKLSLTAPIANYLAEYQGDGRDTRTIADLLSHTSGYNSEVQFFTTDNRFGELFFSQDKTLTSEFLLNQVPFSNARRSTQNYSDTNFMILGLLIERITGMPLDHYVETEIYAPLGLSDTLFVPLTKGKQAYQFAATELQGNTRAGRISFDNIRRYVLRGEVHDEKAHYSMQGVAGHAGLFSTPQDLAILAQLLLNGGGYGNVHLFSQHTIKRFVHPEFVRDSMGLGWRLASPETLWHFGPYASTSAFGHTGWTGTATVIDPELDLAIIYLSNKKHSPLSEQNGRVEFMGDQYPSARYGNIMTLVYEAVLAQTATNKHMNK
jgi:N-acetyl-anhydromuramyl-L-alanine amidase AmpD/CubicO group peptidase (beta-lactamase class C family)